ncbi:MAG: hypothetical protein WCY01_06020 [Alkalispirochaeta sp.]
MTGFKFLIRRIARKFGYEFHRIPSEGNSRVVFPDWKAVFYESPDPAHACFWIPVSYCVDALGYRFVFPVEESPKAALPDGEVVHPYSRTIAAYADGTHQEYVDSPLWDYYAVFRPETSYDIFPEAPGLAEVPGDTHFVPWFIGDLEEQIKKTRSIIRREFRSVKNPQNPVYGPMSFDQGKLEYRRLIDVYQSIAERGFVTSPDPKDDIRGYIIRRNGDFRYLVTVGKHRIAAFAVLHPEGSVPVALRRPVVMDTRDIPSWPLVKRGIWSIAGAHAYVDRLFFGAGVPPL